MTTNDHTMMQSSIRRDVVSHSDVSWIHGSAFFELLRRVFRFFTKAEGETGRVCQREAHG